MQDVVDTYFWFAEKDGLRVVDSITSSSFPVVDSHRYDSFTLLTKNKTFHVDLRDFAVRINGVTAVAKEYPNFTSIKFIKRNQASILHNSAHSTVFGPIVSYRLLIEVQGLHKTIFAYEILPDCCKNEVISLDDISQDTWFLETDKNNDIYVKIPNGLTYIR